MATKPAYSTSGAILYRGPSMIDPSHDIVVIATGLEGRSRNVKTGNMVQLWFLHATVSPIEARRRGLDVAQCGQCPSRGVSRLEQDGSQTHGHDASCYVNISQAPTVIFKAFQRGRYREVSPVEASELLADRVVRLGAYGDGAAAPFARVSTWLSRAKAVNGYTHQWRRFPELSAWCMASCDTPADRVHASLLGFRTFRVGLPDGSEPRDAASEISCPASKEAGHKTVCASCLACGGHSAKARADVTIRAHGPASKVASFVRMRARLAAAEHDALAQA